MENAAQEAQQGSMIAFFVPPKVSSQFAKKFKKLSGDSVDSKYQHITIGLVRGWDGKEDKIKKILNHVCRAHKPFSCRVRSYGTFDPSPSSEHKHVLHAKPEAAEFEDIHSDIISTMGKYGIKVDNGDFEFTPHITIKYCDERPAIEDLDEDLEFVLDSLSFAIGKKKYSRGLG